MDRTNTRFLSIGSGLCGPFLYKDINIVTRNDLTSANVSLFKKIIVPPFPGRGVIINDILI